MDSSATVTLMTMGNTTMSELADKILRSAVTGEWLLIDALHVQIELIPSVEKFVENLLQSHYLFKAVLKDEVKEEAIRFVEREEEI